MKKFGIILLILFAGTIILFPVLIHTSRKTSENISNNRPEMAAPTEPITTSPDNSIMDSSALFASSQSSTPVTADAVEPLPETTNNNRVAKLIFPSLLGILIVFFIIRAIRKRKRNSISYQYTKQSSPDPIPPASHVETPKASKPDYSKLVKQLITENHLRPLGNHKRLALYDSIDDYNVRLLLFSDRKNAEKYYELILSFSKHTPPPCFIEIILLFIPNTIFAEKFGIVLPNEENDPDGIYRTWLRNCFLTCNETLRMENSTDHKYGELHRYVSVVYEWTILIPAVFSGYAEQNPEIWQDDDINCFPALKMLSEADAGTLSDKPEPKGDWIGIVFNIGTFEEAFYGKASIKILQQVVGKENLSETIINGGDLLPDASDWCLAIHTNSSAQYDLINNAVNKSDDSHFAPVDKRIKKIQNPALLSLPYQGFFNVKGEFI